MSLNLRILAREGYTVLDRLSDVGGIEAILIMAISIFLSFWNYKYFDSYMVSHLYKPAEQEFFTPTKYSNIKLFCMDSLPKRMLCCRNNAR